MKIAVVFLSTDPNHFNLSKLKEQASASSKHTIDIYTYTSGKDIQYSETNKFVRFDYKYLANKIGYKRSEPILYHASMGKNVGLEFLPLIDMYMNHKDEYDFYMFYEYDVSYFGSTNLFDTIDFNCDALFPYKRHANDQNWCWTSIEKYRLNDMPVIYHGLLSVYALRGNVIHELIDYFRQGNYCHCEGLISTFVLNNEKYKVNYIDNYMQSLFYWNKIENVYKHYDIIHPVKTINDYNSFNI